MELILIGAGNRGMEIYARNVKLHHPEVKFVAVAEPNLQKRERFSQLFDVPTNQCYESWEHLLNENKMADAAIIATQDSMHFSPTMKALEKGYHVLLEKPISGKKEELIILREYAKSQKRILSIAHVLRYSDFFATIKHLLDDNVVGQLKSIQHQENIGYYHYAHSFVRGPWHRSDIANPIILAKACHDMDLLAWYINAKCTKVSSFGVRDTFIQEMKPKGATERCINCSLSRSCLYHAPSLHEMPKADHLAVILRNEYGSLNEAMKISDYGRCVYTMDNDVMETQITLLEFENGVHASFHLSAFNDEISRYIHIMGTEGEIRANTLSRKITIKRYDEPNERSIQIGLSDSAHEGGDAGIVKGFIEEIKHQNLENGRTSIDKSIMSHLMALAAECSRKENKVVDLKDFENEKED
jgi:predicted dehydrogenase